MKKIILVLLILIVSLFLLFGCTYNKEPKEELKINSSQEIGESQLDSNIIFAKVYIKDENIYLNENNETNEKLHIFVKNLTDSKIEKLKIHTNTPFINGQHQFGFGFETISLKPNELIELKYPLQIYGSADWIIGKQWVEVSFIDKTEKYPTEKIILNFSIVRK